MIEVVRWIDSGLHMHSDGWTDLEVFKSQAKKWHGTVTTAGTNVYEDENVVVLSLSSDEEHDAYYGAQLIWKPSIVSRALFEV